MSENCTKATNEVSVPNVEGELTMKVEQVNDIPLLIAHMMQMGFVEILDRNIPSHPRQRALSWGWTTVIWLAYIISEGDHRKVSVIDYVKSMQESLKNLTGQPVDPLDFDDDRLSHLLTHLSNEEQWHAIEEELSKFSIEIYGLGTDKIRFDATTISGLHKVFENGLMQFGHSKDDPSKPQIKLMAASVDPMGMPIVSGVVSGEQADDNLYAGAMKRVNETFEEKGMLFVGDCKMSALATRACVVNLGNFYLSPLPLTGTVIKEMEGWIDIGVIKNKDGSLTVINRKDDKNKDIPVASGYEFSRQIIAEVNGEKVVWTERVLVVHSPAHAKRQSDGLDTRLKNAMKKINALTPPRGRGRRQIKDEATLLNKIEEIIKKHNVEGLIVVEYKKEVEVKKSFVGKGRGGKNRKTKTIEIVRYQITLVALREDLIAAKKERFGWKAFVTNSDENKMSLQKAIIEYRKEYRIERIFNRLKSRLNIAPLFVKLDDQIKGLTYLLTMAVRVLSMVEFLVRRTLKKEQKKLAGMHPENKKKETDTPTAERILKSFSKISTVILRDAKGKILLHTTPELSVTQKTILACLGLSDSCYKMELRE